MRNINKKGISPLIATVLLIGFTVALAAFVITWGGEFTRDITSDTKDRSSRTVACTNELKFDVKKIDCAADTILIDNIGDIDIKGLTLRYFNINGDNLGVANTGSVNRFQIATINLGTIPASTSQVEAIAILEKEGKNVTCSDSIVTKTFTPAC